MQYLSVTALTRYLKTKLETDEHLQTIALKGEISNFKQHSRGHLYFSLKDQNAQINAIMFAGDASRLKLLPKEGDHVLVMGRISLYEPSGTYSIQVLSMQLDGIGELYLKYEALKKELEEKGYFDVSHKKEIPSFPNTIGVITSPTGAVIQDIQNTINRRFQLVKIILYPTIVQGPESAQSIQSQIKKANEQGVCDVLIVGRGGGSIEDLWGFNERIVAEAIYQSKIPIISAVGHETDVTISDFVADLRAPTPTAAAELATPSKDVLIQTIETYKKRLQQAVISNLQEKSVTLTYLESRLEQASPLMTLERLEKDRVQLLKRMKLAYQSVLSQMDQQLALSHKSLTYAAQTLLQQKAQQFETQTVKLQALNPLLMMDKGFALVTQEDKLIRSVKDIQKGQSLTLKLKDGTVDATVTSIKES
jgi:exodeoxyribonuclease VII large subunit